MMMEMVVGQLELWASSALGYVVIVEVDVACLLSDFELEELTSFRFGYREFGLEGPSTTFVIKTFQNWKVVAPQVEASDSTRKFQPKICHLKRYAIVVS
jgi:hypothetical protein